MTVYPEKMRRWPSAGLFLGRCRRRCPNIKPALGQCLRVYFVHLHLNGLVTSKPVSLLWHWHQSLAYAYIVINRYDLVVCEPFLPLHRAQSSPHRYSLTLIRPQTKATLSIIRGFSFKVGTFIIHLKLVICVEINDKCQGVKQQLHS